MHRHTLFLLLLPLALAARDDVDHCIAFDWTSGGSLDLNPLIAPDPGLPPEIRAGIHVHASEDGEDPRTDVNVLPGNIFSFGKCPKCLYPTIRMLTMCYGPQHQRLDDMWIVINSPDTRRRFDEWCTNNVSTAWATSLPKPFDRILLSTNAVTGAVTPLDPEPGNPNEWSPPVSHSTWLHHNAVYEMRTVTGIAGEHGHQATYDSTGRLIRSTIAAGTADFRRPYVSVLWSSGTIPNGFAHRDADVLPFIMALQLDGNPVIPVDTWRNLNRQCLRQGEHTDAYIARRPILPSGTQPLVP